MSIGRLNTGTSGLFTHIYSVRVTSKVDLPSLEQGTVVSHKETI